MILKKYLFKEMLRTQVVILVILYVVFFSQSIIRLVSDAAVGEIPVAIVTKLAVLAIPDISIVLMPLTLFIAILITLGRICTDSEMVVMRAVGLSPASVMSVALLLAAFTALITGITSIYLLPKASQTQQALLTEARRNPTMLPIESGRFVNFNKEINIYIEEVENQGSEKSIKYIYVMQNPFSMVSSSITTAAKGYLQKDENGVQWIYLNDGTHYEARFASNEYRQGQFKDFAAPVSNASEDDINKIAISSISTKDLMLSDDPKYNVQAQWRIAPIFAIFVLTAIAVPLSMVNPRQGRFAKLMPAILLYASYYMFLLGIINLVNTGRINANPGLYVVPFLFLLCVAIPLNLPRKYLSVIDIKKFKKRN